MVPDVAGRMGRSSFRMADGSAVGTSSGKCGALVAGNRVCSAVDRNGEGGGNVGRGFEEGYAGGGCDGGRGGKGGASMVAMLDSEYDEWTVRFVQDAEGWWPERVALRGGNECAASAGAGSGKDAQHMSSNASNGRKRSCDSRDASRAGSNSKGSRE